MKIKNIALSICALSLCGCGVFDKGMDATNADTVASGTNSALTQQAVQILTTNCVSCHGPSGQGGVSNINDPSADVAAGLIVPGSPNTSPLYTAISSGTMPVGMTMAASDVATIQNWIQTGFGPQPSPSPIPIPSPSASAAIVSFANTIQPTLNNSCVSCHGAGGGNSPLNNYTNVLKVVKAGDPAASQLYTKIAPGGSMAKHAPSGFVTEVSNWITQGALNN